METIKILIKSILQIIQSLYYYQSIKIYLCNHFTIGIKELYRKRTKFPHPLGIVIGIKVKLGYDCTIYQNVTIGAKIKDDLVNAKYPKIGNNVTIYANAVIIGDISIGDNSVIGAGSVVLKDVPQNSIVFGNPSKIK